jgi:hypothetical protein
MTIMKILRPQGRRLSLIGLLVVGLATGGDAVY